LRQTSTQNDTSVTSVQPVSKQQLATNGVATDPPVKKIRKIVPSSVTVGGKKMDPRKRAASAAEQSKASRVALTGEGVSLSSSDEDNNRTVNSPLPPSKADKSVDKGVGKIDMSQRLGTDTKSAKKAAVRKVLEKRLNTNNN